MKKLPPSPSLSQACDAVIPTLAYALLLRHDETSHLNCSHFFAEDDGLRILIPLSKTENYREGKYAFLFKENRSLHDLFFKYLKTSNSKRQNRFLFGPIGFDCLVKRQIIENKKLSYYVFNKIVKDAVSNLGLNPGKFGIHFARSEGATALVPFVTQFELMLSGYWSDPRSIGSYVETQSFMRFEINHELNINI